MLIKHLPVCALFGCFIRSVCLLPLCMYFTQDRHSGSHGSSASMHGGHGMGRPAGRGMPPAPVQPHAGMLWCWAICAPYVVMLCSCIIKCRVCVVISHHQLCSKNFLYHMWDSFYCQCFQIYQDKRLPLIM